MVDDSERGAGLFFIGGEKDGSLTSCIRYLDLNHSFSESVNFNSLKNPPVKIYYSRHSANLIGEFVFLFGGIDIYGRMTNVLTTFDVVSLEVERV